jgi:hypothetical protein
MTAWLDTRYRSSPLTQWQALRNKMTMSPQQLLLPVSANSWSSSPSNTIRSSTVTGTLLHLMILIGKVFNHHLDNSPRVDSFNLPSMPTTGPRHYTNKQPKTTVSIDNVSPAEAGRKLLTMFYAAPATDK